MLPEYVYPIITGCLLVLLLVLSLAVGRLRSAAYRLVNALERQARLEEARAHAAAHDRPAAPPEAATNPNLAPTMHTADRRRAAGYPEAKVREARGLFIKQDGATPTRDAPGLGYAWDMRSNSMRSFAWWDEQAVERTRKEMQQELATAQGALAHAQAIIAEVNAGRHPTIAAAHEALTAEVQARRRESETHTARIRDMKASIRERERKAAERVNAAETAVRVHRINIAEELEANRRDLRFAHARIAQLESEEGAQARIDERVERRRQEREARQAQDFDLDEPAPVVPLGEPSPVTDHDIAAAIRVAGERVVKAMRKQGGKS